MEARAAAPRDRECWAGGQLEGLDPFRAGDIDIGIGIGDAAEHLVVRGGLIGRRVADLSAERFRTEVIPIARQGGRVQQIAPTVLAGLEDEVAGSSDDRGADRSEIGVGAV